jgi:hypothetical protein
MKYFKELLATLKKIEQHLSVIASCVQKDFVSGHTNAKKPALNTKYWNS